MHLIALLLRHICLLAAAMSMPVLSNKMSSLAIPRRIASLPTKATNDLQRQNWPRSDETVRVLISHKRIRERVRQMAQEIRRDFPNEPVHLVGVLKGSILFLADLAPNLVAEVSSTSSPSPVMAKAWIPPER